MSIKIQNKPKFTIWDIEGAVSRPTFLKAKKLFEENKVKDFEEVRGGYWAIVESTKKYRVFIAIKDILHGDCNCYAGENGNICKHALAVGLMALHLSGEPIKKVNIVGDDPKEVKKIVGRGMRKIKAYTGPSSAWFSYSHSLDVGAEMIIEAVQNLSANKVNLKYLWSLVMRLSNKLAVGGVDDSFNGAVGWCADKLVEKIIKMVREDNKLYDLAEEFSRQDTGFGFELELRDGLGDIF